MSETKATRPCQWGTAPCNRSGEPCEHEAIPKERYCPTHRKLVLRAMNESGYLVPLPTEARYRRDDTGEGESDGNGEAT